MPMAIRQFEPSRAVEILAPRYGSGYRIGGKLVLTAAHLLGAEGSDCEVRDKRHFGRQQAKVVYIREAKSVGIDIALLELPEGMADVEPITLGKLADATAGETLAFQMYGYPLWARTQREQGSAAGGRQIDGIIYPSDYSPDEWLVLEAQRLPREATMAKSEWVGASGAAIVCDGLVIAVQRQHQNPDRPASLEASLLRKVYDDKRWRQLLETHGISPEPAIARLPTTDKPLEIAWNDISAKLLDDRRQLTTNLMTRRGDVAYEVDQVFVPLGLVERKKVPRHQEDVPLDQGAGPYRERVGRDSQESGPDREKTGRSSQESDFEQEEITQKFEHHQFLKQVLQQGQSPKSQGKRLAIIGEPGAGKTTLLQQIGRWVSGTFPESVVIWISLADLQKDTLESYLEQRWLRSIIRKLGRATASQTDLSNFADQFRQGRVWLLLDGLDEMQGAGNPLGDIQRQIREGGWLQQARIILTCRVNLWGSGQNALSAFDTYRTLEFTEPGQVEQFIEKWFAPQGDDGIRLGQTLCKALQEPEKKRIRDLVTNPLRLTLLCFDWYAQSGRLPETQAELYQRFVERIYAWKAEEFPTTEDQRQQLNRALARLSLAAMDDQDEWGNARFRLRHSFVKQYLSEESLDLALKLGWLNDIGVDANDLSETVYAFYHTTFEEYFAALAINDWDFFLPRKHRSKPVKHKRYRIFEPQWKQVFLLWLGREGRGLKPQKDALIKALMTFKDGCQGFYSDRAFLLAAEGIAEFNDCAYADAIINRLVQWKFDHSNVLKRLWSDLFDRSWGRELGRRKLATDVLGSTNLQRVIAALAQLLESTQDDDTCRDAAESLGQIGGGNEMAIRALVRPLKSTQDDSLRRNVAESLGQIGGDNETAIRALVQILASTQDDNLRRNVAEGLGKIGVGNETAIRALVRVLESTQEYSIYVLESFGQIEEDNETAIREAVVKNSLRRQAAESLGKIGVGNETAIRELLRILESTQVDDIRKIAAESLGKIGVGNETAIRELVRILESTQEYIIDIPESLGQIGVGNDMAIRKIAVQSTQDGNLRRSAAESLGQIGVGNETAIRELVRILESMPNDYTREDPARSLGQIGVGNETAIRELVRILESTQDDNLRRDAAKSLGQIDPGNETAIQALVWELESAQDDYTRRRAAKCLGQIDPGNETAIRELVRVLESTQDDYTRRDVAESLGQIGVGSETAIRALVRILEFTQDFILRGDVAANLGQIGGGNETTIRELVRILESTQDDYISLDAAKYLGQIGAGNETTIRELVRILESTQDDYISLDAAKYLGQIDPGNETAIRALVQILESAQDDYTRRRAAERLGLIDPGNETTIRSLVRILESTQDDYTRRDVAKSLGRIGVSSETAIQALVRILESTQYDSFRGDVAASLGHIGVGNETAVREMVQAIRHPFRSEEAYRLLMNCAEALPYPVFYQAFNASR